MLAMKNMASRVRLLLAGVACTIPFALWLHLSLPAIYKTPVGPGSQVHHSIPLVDIQYEHGLGYGVDRSVSSDNFSDHVSHDGIAIDSYISQPSAEEGKNSTGMENAPDLTSREANKSSDIRLSSKDYTAAQLAELISLQSPLHGFHQKRGVVNPVHWHANWERKRREVYQNWVANDMFKPEKEPGLLQPPVQWPKCQVFVNDHYRYIWIKGQKVGGTSLRPHLGWICDDYWKVDENQEMPYCAYPLYKKRNATEGFLDRNQWEDYFVFTTIRNPYARFASGFAYLNGKTKCPQSSFSQVCRDPFWMVKVCGILNCCNLISEEISHIMEQSSCMFTKKGRIAVDYVMQTETLNEDFQVVAKEINKRRKEGVPPLNESALVEKLNLAPINVEQEISKVSPYVLKLYQDNPECLGEVEKNFDIDFNRLGYKHRQDVF